MIIITLRRTKIYGLEQTGKLKWYHKIVYVNTEEKVKEEDCKKDKRRQF
jgi:hypothetical protein